MKSIRACVILRRVASPLAIAGACLALVSTPFAAPVSGATTQETPSTGVVLTGSYGCQINTTSYPSAPGTDPLLVRELLHAISINGTGAGAPAGPSTISPGFGGRGRPAPEIVPVNLGSGVGAGFDGGTLDNCLQFGEAVRTVAAELGCTLSPLRTRQAVVPGAPGVQFSFVCEGPASAQVHAIAELDRAVVSQRLGTE